MQRRSLSCWPGMVEKVESQLWWTSILSAETGATGAVKDTQRHPHKDSRLHSFNGTWNWDQRQSLSSSLPPYRLLHAYRERDREELEDMGAHGINEPANGEWAAPIVIAKKDGTIGLCVDYRWLNAGSWLNTYLMPQNDDLIDQIEPAKYISMLDLTKGYRQVPEAERDRPMTAFATPYGL